jgi:hypothetical protein
VEPVNGNQHVSIVKAPALFIPPEGKDEDGLLGFDNFGYLFDFFI